MTQEDSDTMPKTEGGPTPIDPEDIRVGDKVRQTLTPDWGIVTKEFVVKSISRPQLRRWFNPEGTIYGVIADEDNATWELLKRPETPREMSSRWLDPVCGGLWIRSNDDWATAYVCYAPEEGRRLGSTAAINSQIAYRLVSLESSEDD